MAIPGQNLNPEFIASIGDPWIQAMAQADVEKRLASLPRGPGGQIDYNAAAVAMLGRHPGAAMQLSKLGENQALAANRGAHLSIAQQDLDLRRSQMNKPDRYTDEDGDTHLLDHAGGTDLTLTGPNAGQVRQVYQPGQFGTQRGGVSVPTRPATPPQSPVITGKSFNSGALPVPALQTPQQNQAGPATQGQTGGGPSQDDLGALRGAQGTPSFEQGVNLLAQKYGTTPARIMQLIGGQTENLPEPSQSFPGGIARTQMSASDLPPEIGQAFAQAAPAQAAPASVEGPQGLIPTTRKPEGPYDPTRPYSAQQRPPSGSDIRGREKAFQTELGKKRAEEQVKDEAKAATLRNYLLNISEAEKAYTKAAGAGLNNMALGNPVATTALGMGRGVYKGAMGVLGQSPGEPGRIGGGIDAVSAFESNIAQLEQLARQSAKGQGALSDNEGKQLRATLPSLSSNDPKDVARAFRQARQILVDAIRRGGIEVPQ
jgi:hypothetical protein